MNTAVETVGREIRVLSLVSTGHFMSHYSQLILPPLFIMMAPHFGVGFAAMGFIMTLLNMSGALAQIPVGFLVDRVGAKWILITGLFMKTFGLGAMAFTDSYWALLALAVFAGLGHSVFHPTDYAILMSSVGEKRIGRAFSIHTAAGNAGTLAAPLVAAFFLTTQWGWKGAILSVAILGAAAGIAMLAQTGSLQDHVGRKKAKAKESVSVADGLRLLIQPQMLILYMFFCVTAMATVGLNNFIHAGLVKAHGIDEISAAAALSAYAGGGLIGVLLGGWLADKSANHNRQAALAFFIGAVLTILAGLYSLPYAALIIMFGLIGITLGIVKPARDMMVKEITPEGQAGKTYGFMSNGHFIGAAISPVLMGVVMDSGKPTWVFFIAAGFMIVSILTLLNPPKRR
ncbi:MAG: MFS transporter [Rhodospirillaceae bacterium]